MKEIFSDSSLVKMDTNKVNFSWKFVDEWEQQIDDRSQEEIAIENHFVEADGLQMADMVSLTLHPEKSSIFFNATAHWHLLTFTNFYLICYLQFARLAFLRFLLHLVKSLPPRTPNGISNFH
jgi:hypothetical protein